MEGGMHGSGHIKDSGVNNKVKKLNDWYDRGSKTLLSRRFKIK